MNSSNKLQWDEKYSVGVVEIDLQHQKLFSTINELINILGTIPTQEKLVKIITDLIEYKKYHFSTEEKYFKEFNYQDADSHIQSHNLFSQKLQIIKDKYSNDTINLAYELVDFLEDWLIDHLQTEDQKYKECFQSHGLK